MGAEGRADREPVRRQADVAVRGVHGRKGVTRGHRVRQAHARQRARRHRARGPPPAHGGGEPLVPRRVEERARGANRVRAPLRAPHVRGLGPSRSRLLRAAAGSRRVAQRLDQRRSHQLLGSGADPGARPGVVDGIGPHGLAAARADAAALRQPARGRAQRAPTELREPALRDGAVGALERAVSPGAPLQLADDRRGRRSARGPARRGARLLHPLLSPGERLARPGGRHHGRRRRRRRRALLRGHPRRAGHPAADRGGRPDARRGASGARGPHRVPAALSRVALAEPDGRWRRGNRSRGRRTGQRQDLEAVPAPRARPADCPRRLGLPELARAERHLPGGGNGVHARRPAGDRRGASRRAREDGRGRAHGGGDGARTGPGRGALRLPPADDRRLQRPIRPAQRLQRVPRRSRVVRSRPAAIPRSNRGGRAVRRADVARLGTRPWRSASFPLGRRDLALPGSRVVEGS